MNEQSRRPLEEPEVVKLIGTNLSNYLIIKYVGIKVIIIIKNIGFIIVYSTKSRRSVLR